jgi:hypothetical protein
MAKSKVFISFADTEGLTGRRNTLRPPGVLQHSDVALIDGLCWGHCNGFLGSVVGTTRSIAKLNPLVDAQPHPVDRKD